MLVGVLAGGFACLAPSRAQDAPAQAPAKAPDTQAPDTKPQDAAKPQDSASQAAPGDPKPAAPADRPETADLNGCEVPSYLLSTESSLARVTEAVKAHQRLDILVVGSASSALAGPDGVSASYPARLEAALREKLPGIAVNVSTALQLKKTAADVAEGLEQLAKDRKPTLVVWQTGTVDAVRSVDTDDFRSALDDGLTALQGTGTDVLLINLQYSPRMETMITVAPYLDNMRVSAEEHNAPLFDRFAMMRYWNENGHFDLSNPAHDFALAKRVHDCLGQALAAFVIDGARVNTAELRIQR